MKSHTALLRLCLWLLLAAAGMAADSPATKSAPSPEKQLFTGKVSLLREALQRKGISSYDEQQGQVVLETDDGELIPIVSDWRGRAFFQDERLRNRKVDLVGFRRPGVPYLQVLLVYTFDEKGVRNFTDYWCDVCSIPMYELKACECCQEPIRLRFQPQDLPSFVKQPGSKATPSAADKPAGSQ